MRGRTKLAAATVGVIAAAGAATGVVAATGNGSGDPAAELAAAINKRAGTSITAADISGAYQDLLKARLDAAVAAGKLTQAQADDMLARAKDAPLGGPGFGGPGFGPDGPGHVERTELLAPVAGLLKLSEDQLRTKLRSGRHPRPDREGPGREPRGPDRGDHEGPEGRRHEPHRRPRRRHRRPDRGRHGPAGRAPGRPAARRTGAAHRALRRG